jgi:hypothetical protein
MFAFVPEEPELADVPETECVWLDTLLVGTVLSVALPDSTTLFCVPAKLEEIREFTVCE